PGCLVRGLPAQGHRTQHHAGVRRAAAERCMGLGGGVVHATVQGLMTVGNGESGIGNGLALAHTVPSWHRLSSCSLLTIPDSPFPIPGPEYVCMGLLCSAPPAYA